MNLKEFSLDEIELHVSLIDEGYILSLLFSLSLNHLFYNQHLGIFTIRYRVSTADSTVRSCSGEIHPWRLFLQISLSARLCKPSVYNTKTTCHFSQFCFP